jgi:Tol biopolymer transport system component
MVLVSRWQAGPGTYDIWRLDLARGTEERLTDDRGSEVTPVFSEDGREIFFSADRGGSVPTLFRKDLVSGAEQPVIPGTGIQQLLMDVIPGQRTIVFTQRSRQGTYDIFQLPLAGGPPAALVESRPDKSEVRVSPDGRALAFIAFDGNRAALYVAPLPITSPPIAVVADLWGVPRWSRDGRQLYYIGPGNTMMGVPVQTGPSLKVGTPQRLFQLKQPPAVFDVSRDGRFLLLVPQFRSAEQPIIVAIAAVRGSPG